MGTNSTAASQPPGPPGPDFVSENTSPVHPRVVEALVQANTGCAPSFEQDAWTSRAIDRLRETFEHDVVAYPVITGTAANAIALSSLTPPYGAVLCHGEAHILTDECGAVEMFTAGARLVAIEGDHGKVNPGALLRCLEEGRLGVVHAVQPAVLTHFRQLLFGTAGIPDS